MIEKTLTACLIVRGKPSRMNPDSWSLDPVQLILRFESPLKVSVKKRIASLPLLVVHVCGYVENQPRSASCNYFLFCPVIGDF